MALMNNKLCVMTGRYCDSLCVLALGKQLESTFDPGNQTKDFPNENQMKWDIFQERTHRWRKTNNSFV